MNSKLDRASAIAVAATIVATLFSAAGSGAAAQDKVPVVAQSESRIRFAAEPLVQQVPEARDDAAATADLQDSPAITASSLAQLVSARLDAAESQPDELSRELNCLAGAVYFEAKSETLAGQLAVGRVVVARSKSGRFPNSYCGVVFQPSQFSFVRGNAMPGINHGSQQWKNAMAIARIAHDGSWRSPVEGALFFHAAYVSPGWRLTRIARVDNHVFYR